MSIYDTNSFGCIQYDIQDEKLPEGFSGYRIALVSDLHNTQYGKGNSKLISELKNAAPDIIVITGDLVDSSHTDIAVALDFAENAVKIAPTYYVSGNHEAWLLPEEYTSLKEGLTEKGVSVLENESLDIEHDGDFITLIGVIDPDFGSDYGEYGLAAALEELTQDSEHYTVLLSHRPEFFELYRDYGINLVLSGHTHAGQIRLPFIGAVMAPGQGIFPKYDKCIFNEGDTTMIVSAGLGNSVIPFRLFNRAELNIITLSAP